MTRLSPTSAFAISITTVLATDQVSKALVRTSLNPGESVRLLGSVLSLSYVRNTGAAFGVMQGQRGLLVLVATVVLALVGLFFLRSRPSDRLTAVALGLVCGGASGNLVDRLFIGTVTDFLDVHFWPVFNVADSAIVAGVGLLALRLVSGFGHEDTGAAPGGGEGHGRDA